MRAAVRLVWAGLLSFCLAASDSQAQALAGLVLGLGLLAAARPAGAVHTLAAVNGFVIFMCLTIPLSPGPGEALWQWGPFRVTQAGLDLSLLLALKANAIACVCLGLLATLGASQLALGLARLRCPPKLVWIVLLMGRNIHLLRGQWRALSEAGRLRGFRATASARGYRTLASMLGLLILRAHDRAGVTREAMLLRGYGGRLPLADDGSIGAADVLCSIFLALCLAALLWLGFAAPSGETSFFGRAVPQTSQSPLRPGRIIPAACGASCGPYGRVSAPASGHFPGHAGWQALAGGATS